MFVLIILSLSGFVLGKPKYNDVKLFKDISEVLAKRVEESMAERVEESMAKRVEESMAERVEESMSKRVEDSMAKRVEESMAKRVEESMAKRVEEAMAERVEESMEKRVEESMAKRVPPTFSMLGIKRKFVRINLHSGNNQTQGVREEIIIKQTKSSNSSQHKKSLLNKPAKLRLPCSQLSGTVLIKRLMKMKSTQQRHKLSQRWLKECANETRRNKDAKSHIKYFG